MRSLASSGASGGISKSLRNVIRVLDAAGFGLVLVESVGAGQVDVDIANVVNLTVVVLSPQTGDKIQVLKPGLTKLETCTLLINLISKALRLYSIQS